MAAEMFGPYRLDRLLGRGGMGEVHLAFDTVKRRAIALKRLPRELAVDEHFQARFRRESEVAARLREPHVIPIHDFGEIDGQLFIDMRLVDGVDLGEHLQQFGPLPPARTVTLLSQVAGALDAAHRDGLVHRDVKPSNILVTDDDFAYLIDFGVARDTTSTILTASGSAVGTTAYMAPERFGGGHVDDRRVDVYSLACVLYETLTGCQPFPTLGLPAQIYAHLSQPPPRVRDARSDIPPAIDEVIARGMAKEPVGRYPTAGELMAAARTAVEEPSAGGEPSRDQFLHNSPRLTSVASRTDPTGSAAVFASAGPATPPPVPPAWRGPAPPPAGRPDGGRTGVGRKARRRWWRLPPTVVAVAGVVAAVLFMLPPGIPTEPQLGSSSGTTTTQDAPAFPPGSTMAAIAAAGTLRVGTKFDLPAFGYLDSGGMPTGFDVEIAKIIAGKLGIPDDRINYTETPYRVREQVIVDGEVDIVVATYTINDVRRQDVSFAGPYIQAGQDLMVAADNTTITGPESLRPTNARVCSVTGSTPARNLEQLMDPVNIVLFDTYAKCADALRNGQVEAVSTDNVILIGLTQVGGGAFEVVGQPFTNDPYGVGIRKGDVEFCEFINDALAEAQADGSYAAAWTATAGPYYPLVPTLPTLQPCS